MPCRSNNYLLPLLEALGGEVAVDRLLELADTERKLVLELGGEVPSLRLLKALCARSYPSEREERRGGAEREPIEVNMVQAGFKPLEEPNLAKGIAALMSDRIKRLRLGSFTIDESTHVMGVADPTGSLLPGTVCVVRKGEFLNKKVGAHKEVLLYRSPGQHPGDVRKVRLAPPPDELQRALGELNERDSAIIFPVLGARSLADEMAGGDLDGDTFAVIWDEKLVPAVQCVPALTEAEQQAHAGTAANEEPPALDVNELQRERHHAAKVHQQRLNSHLVGVAGNEWLKMAETQGAGSADARRLACIYYIALDAAKSGQRVPQITGRLTSRLPPHLKDHKCGKSISSFDSKPGTTVLARLHALDAAPSSSPSARMRDYMSMIPPDFRPDGRRYKEQLEFDATWTQLRKEYGYETSKMKEEGNWDGYDECVERYREKLLEGEDEWINPPLNSTLLAKVGLGLGLGLGSGSGLGLALALALAPTQP
jgi:RNA-dependent RNA polymerase